MKAGFARLARTIGRIEARMDTHGDGQQFPIARGSGMLGLRTAIQAVRARQIAPPSPPVGTMPNAPLSPLARLRADILAEQTRREARGPEAYADVPATYDDEPSIEEQKPCAITPQPETSNE
jgi:hypothetical protein